MAHPSKTKGDAEKARRLRAKHRALGYQPDATWHGTTNGYTNRCCRCDLCRAAFREYHDRWRAQPSVAERIRAHAREWGRANPQAKRAATYGLKVEELERLLAAGACAACGTTEPGPHGWAVDHDHYCCPGKYSCGKCVRGIVCRSCNQALGQVRDNPEHLRSLATYIERWRGRASKSA